MSLARVAHYLKEAGAVTPLIQALAGTSPTLTRVGGLATTSRAAVIAALAQSGQMGLFIARNHDQAQAYLSLFESFNLDAAYFPGAEASLYESGASDSDTHVEQQRVLARVLNGEVKWVITTPRGLAKRLVVPDDYRAACQALRVGDRTAPAKLVQELVRLGYRAVPQVNQIGDFARRGGIVDVFSPAKDTPVRLEWFGDEIDSMRAFETESQRSGDSVPGLTLIPVGELLLPMDGPGAFERHVREAFVRAQKKLNFIANRLKAESEQAIARLAAFNYFEGCGYYAPFIHERMGTLLDYLPVSTALYWEERAAIASELKKWGAKQDDAYLKGVSDGRLLPLPYLLHLSGDECLNLAAVRHQVDFSIEGACEQFIDGPEATRFHSDFDKLAIQLNQWQHAGQRVLVVTQQPQRAFAILDERGVSASLSAPPEAYGGETGGIWVVREGLAQGCAFPDLKLVVLTDLELFGQHRRSSGKRYRKFTNQGASVSSVAELKPGDYVVHAKHGIGRYVGLTRMAVDNQEREYLSLVYLNDDKLFVPVEQVNLLHRYRASGEGAAPRLHKMGGVEWENTKKRVKKGLLDLADDLVKLYAERASLEGFAYPPDTPWQREMEESFPYQETLDQLKAIQETKADMEKPRPMDRLVCGDVGFGKTEVAIRATFKAVMAGKQVAILAPTTVLAQQHYMVFRERFAPYPIRVGLLSRFRTAKEQKEVVSKLRSGEMDVVIGTHRLLSKDMGFNALGLVVIDEEHRFGVANKERLKQVKSMVDVLTMSATPIPRTLYMALSGARDMSLIATPPLNRQPVKTIVGPYDPEAVRQAILHEIGREGQVFFLHNRIESIGTVALQLAQLVPEARVRVAHGQMNEAELEDIMLSFKDHQFDILLCTTIIESGLDIPRANTMIIDNADGLGLAQLYQLRGRVGRSETKAYCHCYYRAGKELTDEARDRLQALSQFTALGSGYQIAMRDLEIRGVGNLLGAEQHGHMVSIGFDLYTQLLEEAIESARGSEVTKPLESTVVDLHVSAFIPEDYLGEGADKMAQYRRLASVTGERELALLQAEWQERFGKFPTSVTNLFRIVGVKLLATELGIQAIRTDSKFIRIQGGNVTAQAFFKVRAADRGLSAWNYTAQEITLGRGNLRPEDELTALERLLKPLADSILSAV